MMIVAYNEAIYPKGYTPDQPHGICEKAKYPSLIVQKCERCALFEGFGDYPISAHDVKKLRELTGAGMVECKKALLYAQGNFDDAIDFLRCAGNASICKCADFVPKL